VRGLGWVSRRLPRHPWVRSLAGRALAPGAAWALTRVGGWFDFAPPSDAYRTTLPADAGPFLRAVYAWLGVEGSVMRHGSDFRLTELADGRCVERLYLRDESGAVHAGCPWGQRRPEDGFACRTVMMGAQPIFRVLRDAELKVDISIPELAAIERLARAHTERDPDRLLSALEPEIHAVFAASRPEEPDFLPLRPETRAAIRELVASVCDGRPPALYCQFRILRV
jgi:hypothetical protein